MIKVKTFKVGDESINELLAGTGIIQGGVQAHGDNITVIYREGKYPQYDKEAKLQKLHADLIQEEATLDQATRELKYVALKSDEDETKKDMTLALENKQANTTNMIVILKEEIESLK